MNRFAFKASTGVWCAVALSACSTQQLYEVDAQKVAQIERAAARAGTQIQWVRYPQKPVDQATQKSPAQ